MVSMQLLLHNIGIKKSTCDGRHNKGDTLMRYEKNGGPPSGMMMVSEDKRIFTLNSIKYLYHDNTFMSEVTGVLHLVHTWSE
jgi:hypothetical protein